MTNTNSKEIDPNTFTDSAGDFILGTDMSVCLHAWCEDKYGNVVFDPEFDIYNKIYRHNNCVGPAIRKRRPEWRMLAQDSITRNKEKHNNYNPHTWKNPEYLGCVMNSYSYYEAHPDTKWVVGQYGWKQTTGDMLWMFG